MRFTDPRTDFAFKKIFGDENAKEVLISFLNAVLALDKDHAIVDVTLLNPYEAPKTKYMRDSFLDVKYLDEIRYYFIELLKFTRTEEELETYLEKWVYFIKHAADLETIPEKLDEPVFHKAFDQANRANMTAKELEAYDNSVTVMLDERGRIDGAYEKGGQNMAYEIARSMKQDGAEPAVIAKWTRLTLEEIEKL